ncbi:hypothetical protein P3T25_009325 [Paraburkholderia sp. GAS32]
MAGYCMMRKFPKANIHRQYHAATSGRLGIAKVPTRLHLRPDRTSPLPLPLPMPMPALQGFATKTGVIALSRSRSPPEQLNLADTPLERQLHSMFVTH